MRWSKVGRDGVVVVVDGVENGMGFEAGIDKGGRSRRRLNGWMGGLDSFRDTFAVDAPDPRHGPGVGT